VQEKRRINIKEIATIAMQCRHLSSAMNMHCIAAKLVPRLLTPEQKERRVAICEELRQRALGDPSLGLPYVLIFPDMSSF
jgi:hypothetical protein